tara:strand:+ start:6563 stop:6898 length:336 start_codon:yes stop_codon:yes gene_type:complete
LLTIGANEHLEEVSLRADALEKEDAAEEIDAKLGDLLTIPDACGCVLISATTNSVTGSALRLRLVAIFGMVHWSGNNIRPMNNTPTFEQQTFYLWKIKSVANLALIWRRTL